MIFRTLIIDPRWPPPYEVINIPYFRFVFWTIPLPEPLIVEVVVVVVVVVAAIVAAIVVVVFVVVVVVVDVVVVDVVAAETIVLFCEKG